jgi:tetratricopeptide (TPR) repeat protein
VEDLAARLADSRRRLDELEVDDLSVRASFELSYRALSPEQARAFAFISLCDARELPVPAVAALIGADDYAAGSIAERLVDLNLLVSLAPGRYRHHDLLRLFAREKLDASTTATIRQAALKTLCTAYAEMLRDATMLTRPGYVADESGPRRFTTPEAAWAWQETEVPFIVGLVEQCAVDTDDVSVLADLLHQAQGYLRSRGQWDDWERAASALLAASVRTRDPRAELTARSHLGQLANLYGQFRVSATHLLAALELTRQLGDRVQEAAALNRIGMLEFACEETESAIRRHELAYDICKSMDDLHGMCANLTNIGKCLITLDRPIPALEALTTALAHAQELADDDLVTMVTHHVARCHALLGQFDLAIAEQSRVVRATRARGMREGEAFSLAELGRALLAADRPARAIASLERAVTLFRELRSPVGIAGMLEPLIEALRRDGQLDRAEQLDNELADLLVRIDPAAAPEVKALPA